MSSLGHRKQIHNVTGPQQVDEGEEDLALRSLSSNIFNNKNVAILKHFRWVLIIQKFVVSCSDSTGKNLELYQFWAEVCRSLGECSDQEVAAHVGGWLAYCF